MDTSFVYDLIYATAALGGRDQTLFGAGRQEAREVFCRSMVDGAYPELWFELPLAGDPWFDLHVLVDHADVTGSDAHFAGQADIYDEALAWFASQTDDARQLALSYDSHTGKLDSPALQLLTRRSNRLLVLGFLKAAGRPDVRDDYIAFRERLPKSWFACYTGLFPGRAAMAVAPHLRVECIAKRSQQEYASNPSLLRDHLHMLGANWVNDELINRCQELAQSPFPLEFQFDVEPGGRASSTFSASLRFDACDWLSQDRRAEIAKLMERTGEWGLSDDRWKQLSKTAFAKRYDKDGEAVRFYCLPAFIKLRWRDGEPLDAKAYLQATMSSQRVD